MTTMSEILKNVELAPGTMPARYRHALPIMQTVSGQFALLQGGMDRLVNELVEHGVIDEIAIEKAQQLLALVERAAILVEAGPPPSMPPEAWDSFLSSMEAARMFAEQTLGMASGPGVLTYVGVGVLALAVGVGVWYWMKKR